MRVAAFSTFRKLYRVINEPLVGNFTVYVTNSMFAEVFIYLHFAINLLTH
jgi:hypothetical protein